MASQSPSGALEQRAELLLDARIAEKVVTLLGDVDPDTRTKALSLAVLATRHIAPPPISSPNSLQLLGLSFCTPMCVAGLALVLKNPEEIYENKLLAIQVLENMLVGGDSCTAGWQAAGVLPTLAENIRTLPAAKQGAVHGGGALGVRPDRGREDVDGAMRRSPALELFSKVLDTGQPRWVSG
jgi:hypothetical protein